MILQEDKLNDKELKSDKHGLISRTLTKEKLKDLYYVQNKSLQDIANEYNCTRPMVKMLMDKYFLKRRKRSEARVLAIKKGKFENLDHYIIDENFFSKWSARMAWVLGLIFTDGCFQSMKSTRKSVQIISKDLKA